MIGRKVVQLQLNHSNTIHLNTLLNSKEIFYWIPKELFEAFYINFVFHDSKSLVFLFSHNGTQSRFFVVRCKAKRINNQPSV